MTEIWVVCGLVAASVIGLFWNKIVAYILEIPADKTSNNPDAYQRRMDLVNELLRECEACDVEKKAVIELGNVIAAHWRECLPVTKGGRSK